jgi:uncharacterized protein YjiS (DUF1127 family)
MQSILGNPYQPHRERGPLLQVLREPTGRIERDRVHRDREQRAGQDQELMELDDRMLRDVGLGRGNIEQAVRSGRDPA